MFIVKTQLESNVDKIQVDLTKVLEKTPWINNQIGLRHRINALDKFSDCVGSLFSKQENKFIASEYEFNQWSIDNLYLQEQIENLCSLEKFTLGRVRFIRLLPKTGLSVHKDKEVRYHLVLTTNSNSYICHNTNTDVNSLNQIAVCYHIPKDGFWYKVDTRETHWVYNGGLSERIHLVVCES